MKVTKQRLQELAGLMREDTTVLGKPIRVDNLEVAENDLQKMTWDEAIKKVKELGQGWRLPTKEEFEKIIAPNMSKIPKLEHKRFWSSSLPSASEGDPARSAIAFGFVGAPMSVEGAFKYYKSAPFNVRVVRSL